MKVSLFPADKRYLLKIAHTRNDHKIGVVRNRNVCGAADLDLHKWGLDGEFAVSIMINVPMDTTQKIGGDKGIDFIKDGMKYQVKFNTYVTGILYFNVDEKEIEIVWDYAILTVPWVGGADVIGWTTREFYLKNRKIVNWGFGPRWGIEQKDLFPIIELPGYETIPWYREDIWPLPPSYFDLHPEDIDWHKDPNVWLPTVGILYKTHQESISFQNPDIT